MGATARDHKERQAILEASCHAGNIQDPDAHTRDCTYFILTNPYRHLRCCEIGQSSSSTVYDAPKGMSTGAKHSMSNFTNNHELTAGVAVRGFLGTIIKAARAKGLAGGYPRRRGLAGYGARKGHFM